MINIWFFSQLFFIHMEITSRLINLLTFNYITTFCSLSILKNNSFYSKNKFNLTLTFQSRWKLNITTFTLYKSFMNRVIEKNNEFNSLLKEIKCQEASNLPWLFWKSALVSVWDNTNCNELHSAIYHVLFLKNQSCKCIF